MNIAKLTKASKYIEVSQLLENGYSKYEIFKFVKNNNYKKISKGLYSSNDNIDDNLIILCKRCPKGVLSHDEALYYHGLIDREPIKHTITVYSGYNSSKLNKEFYKVFYVKKELLDVGKIKAKTNFNNLVPIYDLERTIIDLIRSRSQFEIQDFSCALKSYIRKPNKDLNKLLKYAKLFHIENLLRMYLEVLL